MSRIVIGHTNCHSNPEDKGKPVYASKPKCVKCHPRCPDCPCYLNTLFFECIKLNHDCACHKEKWVDRSLDCDKCGKGVIRQALKYAGLSPHRDVLQKGLRLKLKGFKGTLRDKYALIKEVEKSYEQRYTAACLTREERDLRDKMRPYITKVIREAMWTYHASSSVQARFPTFDLYLEYMKNFDEYGHPLAGVPF